jgi:hypothetical protein
MVTGKAEVLGEKSVAVSLFPTQTALCRYGTERFGQNAPLG